MIARVGVASVEEALRARGEARCTVVQVAQRQGLMLSVHRANTEARRFYGEKGLEIAPTSPSQCAPPGLAASSTHEVMQLLWDGAALATIASRGHAAKRRLYERFQEAQPQGGGDDGCGPSVS